MGKIRELMSGIKPISTRKINPHVARTKWTIQIENSSDYSMAEGPAQAWLMLDQMRDCREKVMSILLRLRAAAHSEELRSSIWGHRKTLSLLMEPQMAEVAKSSNSLSTA